MKKSLEKSKIILEEKRKNGQAKNLHKKDTFTIIASHPRANKHLAMGTIMEKWRLGTSVLAVLNIFFSASIKNLVPGPNLPKYPIFHPIDKINIKTL